MAVGLAADIHPGQLPSEITILSQANNAAGVSLNWVSVVSDPATVESAQFHDATRVSVKDRKPAKARQMCGIGVGGLSGFFVGRFQHNFARAGLDAAYIGVTHMLPSAKIGRAHV